jgi:hypothetical protein
MGFSFLLALLSALSISTCLALIAHPERQTNNNNILRRINARKYVKDLQPTDRTNKDFIDNVEVTRKSFGVNNKFTRRKRVETGGFTLYSEALNGRIAMAAFSVGLTREFFTGESLLQQIGLHDQKCGFLFVAAVTAILGISINKEIEKKAEDQ